ncbi:MAG: ClC family H(+)/Cl(-) exchange transporter [Bifidobacterium sp.]|nr:ClC family H(+)/Cl(-) exchange transporter [Bifidobacterium sp.]
MSPPAPGSSRNALRRIVSQLMQRQWIIALRAILCGFLAGFLVVLYRQGIIYATGFARWTYASIAADPWLLIPFVPAAAVIGLFVGWLIKLEPMAGGSGIPQVEGIVRWGLRMRWAAVLPVRFVGGILCGMFGLSLGREGPSIQIGAAGSQALSHAMKRKGIEANYLMTSGAAAGLSAAFNAPLSGMMFAVEEVHKNLSPVILISATAASLSADVVSKYWFGLTPVLDFTRLSPLSLPQYVWMIPLGVVAGLVGSLMNQMLLGLQTLYNRLPVMARPVIALLMALPFGIFAPMVLGGGEVLIDYAERATTGILLLLGLLVAKMVFTSTSFGSGVPGGIFMPILAVGTLTGSVCGIALSHVGLPVRAIPVFAVCAMAGALAASVKAPVTSILLTVEMSGTLIHMLPVTACAFTALFVSDLLRVKPIYEALLERYMQGDRPVSHDSSGNALLEFPVALGSRAAGRTIGELDWPDSAAVVDVRRGEDEVIPCRETVLVPGDYVLVLFPAHRVGEVRRALVELCETHV